MARILIIGNAGGGKSVLARKIAAKRGLPYREIDTITWKPGWQPYSEGEYEAAHAKLIAEENWVLDGLGWTETLPERFARATEIILIDMPIWMHFWLAAERQFQWAQGKLENPVAGIAEMPPTRAMFQALWETDQEMAPVFRRLTDQAEREGKPVTRIASVEALDAFAAGL
jgi:adenylate kinase family enzyme